MLKFSDKNQICYCPESRILYKKYFQLWGEHHDWQKPNWKPFKMLERYCEDLGYDFYEALDMNIGRVSQLFLK